MVKVMMGKRSRLLSDDIACESHYKSHCAGHWTSLHERRESTVVELTVTGFPRGGFTIP